MIVNEVTNMIKIVHISDIHIGASFKSASFAGEFALKRQKEIKETFFKVLKYCDDNHIDVLLISGDMFDTEFMKKSDIDNVYNGLKSIKSKVFIIAGNHDPLKEDSYWNVIKDDDNIHIFGNSVTSIYDEELNLELYGHSWDSYYIEEEIFASIPKLDPTKINVLVGHGEVNKSKSKYLPINKKNLLSYGFDYIALGHIHKHEFFSDRMAYAGSLEPFDFSETGEHGFIKIELDNESISSEFIPFSKREFVVKEILLTGELSEKDIYDLISNCDSEGKKSLNLYRIILQGRYNYQINLDKNHLKELFNEEFAYVEFKNNAKFDIDIEQIKKENSDNIIGKFIDVFSSLDLENEINRRSFEIGLEELLNAKEGYNGN